MKSQTHVEDDLTKVIQIFRGIRHSEMFYDGYKKAWVLSSYVTRGHFKETLQLSMVTQQSFRNVEFQSTCQKKPLSFITMKIILGNYQCSEVFFCFSAL